MPSHHPLSVDKICQGLEMQAGGRADRQALLSGTGAAQRQTAEPCLMTPQAHLSIATFPSPQGPVKMPQIPHYDVSADKQRRKLGNGYSLVYGLVPSEWTRPLTLKSSRQNCEAGSRTTLETKIVTGGNMRFLPICCDA